MAAHLGQLTVAMFHMLTSTDPPSRAHRAPQAPTETSWMATEGLHPAVLLCMAPLAGVGLECRRKPAAKA